MPSSPSLAAVVLAAGKGTRMKSARPKVLHRVAGREMIAHVLAAVAPLGCDAVVVVAAPGDHGVVDAAAPARVAFQDPPRGTGDATATALEVLGDFPGTVLVAFGDTPLVTTGTLARLAAARAQPDPPGVVLTGFETGDPARYGSLVQASDGSVERIVEFGERGSIDRPVRLYNGGLMALDGARLKDWLSRVRPDNSRGEVYLTDIVALARGDGARIAVEEVERDEVMGVDTRPALARAEALAQQRLRAAAMEAGASLVAPQTVFLSWDTVIGPDAVIHPYVTIGPGTVIREGAEIRSFCHIEGASIGAGARIGPHAHLRPGTGIGPGARVGNFVEIKASSLEAGAKASHLSYIGDASVGEDANIGAGTITCNYDGFDKHRTEIGAGAFIGSNTALVAPVRVGPGAIVGAGSTITDTVEADAVAVVRGESKVAPGAANRFRARRTARNS